MHNISFDYLALTIIAGVVYGCGFLYYIKKTLWIIQRNILDIQGNTLEKMKENLEAIKFTQLDNFKGQNILGIQRDTLEKISEISEKIKPEQINNTMEILEIMDGRLYRAEKLLSRLTAKLAPLAPGEADFPYF